MLRLLKTNIEYQFIEADPPEFVKLYNTFRTNSVISIGLTFGVNNVIIKTISKIDFVT